MKYGKFITVSMLGCCLASAAIAQEIKFKFNNPSFGGSSFNSSHLLGLAEIQKQHHAPTGGGGAVAANDASAAFIRQLESRLLASIATDLVNQITGAEVGTADTVVVGDQQIDFSRDDESLRVQITNLLTGASTELVLPTLLFDN